MLLLLMDMSGVRIGFGNIVYVVIPFYIIFLIMMLIAWKGHVIKLCNLDKLYLILVVVMNFISFTSSSFVSLRYTVLITIWFLLYIIVSRLLTNISTKDDVTWKFIQYFNSLILFYVVISIIYHFLFSSLLRLYGFNTGLGPNELALFCVTGIVLSYSLINKYKIYRYYVNILVLFVGLILTGSRTSMLGLFILLIIILATNLYKIRYKVSKATFTTSILILICLPIITYYSGLVVMRFYTEIMLAYKLHGDILLNPLITSYRLQGLFVAKDILSDSITNLVIGTGFEDYRTSYKHVIDEHFQEDLTVHSVYLQILIGGGIVSLTAFCLYTYGLIRSSLKIDDNLLRITIMRVLFLVLFYMLLGSTFVNRIFYFALPLMIYLAIKSKRKMYI